MINRYYMRIIKKLIEKNTQYECSFSWQKPKPYLILENKDLEKLLKCIDRLEKRK